MFCLRSLLAVKLDRCSDDRRVPPNLETMSKAHLDGALVDAIDDQNALVIDFASATQRPRARPTQFGTLSPSASHPCAPATQTNCAHALSLCLLSVRHARLPSPELCTNLQLFMLSAIDEAPESYALVNSHCCDTIRMSFMIFVCDFSGARSDKSSPVSAYF